MTQINLDVLHVIFAFFWATLTLHLNLSRL
jgi:hypothetical protein